MAGRAGWLARPGTTWKQKCRPALLLAVGCGCELGASGDARWRGSGGVACVACRPLLGFVHLSSERTLEPVRQDCSFAKKQESPGRAPGRVSERLALAIETLEDR
jgi:hypothetical protein